jgi:pilus assembly protein CpaB
MTQRIVVILLIALVIATGASFLVYRAVVRQGRANATVQVVAAARDLEVGTLIKDTDLKNSNWPGLAPKGVALKKDVVLGRGVVLPIYEGEPINESRLATPGAGGGLAATIPPGKRACAVRVNEVVGVAGFISPGMHVDVLISGSPPGQTFGPKVRTLLQNIEVLSAGQNIQKDAEGKPIQVPVVNLLVTPEQAETLSLASNETRIQLVLRNPLDAQIEKTPGNEMTRLFAPDRAEPKSAPRPVSQPREAPPAPRPAPAIPVIAPPPPPPPPHRIEVINGPKKSEAQFPTKMEAR